MLHTFPQHHRLISPSHSLAALACIAVLGASLPALAQGTHLWTQSRLEEFEKGTPKGVAISSDGHLREGPGLTELATTPSTYVWSIAADKAGVAYAGTASPATVLRIGADGKPFTLFETKDLAVQVVRLSPDGSLYAATLPSGKVFKLNPAATDKQDDTSATVVFDFAKTEEAKPAAKTETRSDKDKSDSKSRFIWDMVFDPAGRLYIATGGPAAIYRIDPAKPADKPEQYFKTDEQHIRCLAWDAKGNLIAGTDGSGLVYRISPLGKGYVLFEAPRREITSVAVAASGIVYASSVGDKSHNPLPPLPVQGAGMATITILQPGSMAAANQSSTLPEGTEIYAIAEGQAPRKLWSSKDEIVYALASRPDGLLALTGNRGRIFRIADDGSFADLAHLDAQQGLCLSSSTGQKGQPDPLFIGSANTGKLYSFGSTATHEYASDVLDAGALSRFGRVELQPGSSGFEIQARTGNVEQPVRGRSDWGWSDWQPLKDGVVASPTGRFLQWKAILRPGGTIGAVGVNYLPVNAAPEVDDIVVVAGARLNPQSMNLDRQSTVSIQFPSPNPINMSFDGASNAPLQASKDRTSITIRWAAHDDNGDDLTFSLYLRGDGESVWRLLKDKITDKAYSFDAALVPDGGYQIKVLASDSPSHTPTDALTGFKESDRFEIDTTPPVVSALTAVGQPVNCERGHCPKKFKVTLDAEDAFSPIAHAEYSLDAGPWQYVEPVGGLSDSRREHYEIPISVDAASTASDKITEHLITVRVYDRHDNVGVAKTVIPASEK